MEAIIIEGLVYGIMVLGVYISFRIMDFPDLTVDGSFVTGAAIMAIAIINKYSFFYSLILAFAGGAIAGAATAIIHNKLKIPNLLAGILTMTMLYSINLRIMGSPNLPLLKNETIFTVIAHLTRNFFSSEIAILILCLFSIIVIKLLLDLFFHTDIGLAIRALGSNEQMVIAQGINPEVLKIIGLSISNGIVALSGAFAAQYQGFADVGMGPGTIIAGLASVLIGEFFIRSRRLWIKTTAAIIGSIIYRAILFMGMSFGYGFVKLNPNDNKFISGALILLFLFLSRLKINQKRKNYD